MTDETRRISIHESGHAVLAELLYMNPESVTIEPTEATLGHLRRRRYCFSPLDTWRDLIILCGGHVAEGLTAEDEISDEYFESYGALRAPYSYDEITDGARIWTSLGEHSEDEHQRLTWFELAYAQTRRVLSNRAVWRSVESLARRLMEKRTLDYAEAAEVIEAALGRSKWGREQFKMGERYAWPPQTWIESREEYREMERALAAYAKK